MSARTSWLRRISRAPTQLLPRPRAGQGNDVLPEHLAQPGAITLDCSFVAIAALWTVLPLRAITEGRETMRAGTSYDKV
jgi:hypothetical protein